MVFNINDYPGRVAMHCETEKEALDFCEYLASTGRVWRGGQTYTSRSNWTMYKDKTCYYFNDNSFCDIGYFVENGFKILKWSDFSGGFYEETKEEKCDCKNCLNMCRCCKNKETSCSLCKPFGKLFEPDTQKYCVITGKQITLPFKFEVDQEVIIRNDLKNGAFYDNCYVGSDMYNMRGSVVHISYRYNNRGRKRYTIKEDGGKFAWAENMFK